MRKTIIASLCTSLLALPLFGDWNMEYTFDGPDLPEEAFTAVNREGSTEFADVMDGMLRVNHGDLLEQTSNLWVMLPLSEDIKQASIDAGGEVTVYFEMMQPLVNGEKAIVDVAWGLGNIDPDVVLEERYDSFSAMQRIESTGSNWEIRDGGDYVAIGQLQADEVYKVWMVVDYTLNFMTLYAQGGQYAEQTEVALGAFRVNPSEEQTVDYFTMGLSSGNSEDGAKGVDFMFFDNIAIDPTGVNLTEPQPTGETWYGYPVDGQGFVDTGTGGWLNGFVNVAADPWIYVYSMSKYIYIPDDQGWMYVPN